MTRALLLGLAEIRGGLVLPATVLVLVLLPIALVVDGARGLRRAGLEAEVARRTSYRCRRGHDVAAAGAIVCPSCGLTSEVASIFAEGCSFCAIVPDAIQCACGASVRNPLAEPLA